MPLSSAPQPSFPVVDGTPLETVWYGPQPGAAPTIIFLHEGLGSVRMWRDFPQQLASETGCSALVYSRRGYGQSGPAQLPRPTSYLHHEGLVVLPQLLETLGVREHLVLGHSDGGSIALIYAGGAPRPGLLGVITEAAHVFNEPLSHASIQATRVAYDSGDLRDRLSRYHADVDNAFRGWNDVWLSDDFWNWNLQEYLPQIRVPLLVIQGENDQYGTVKQVDTIVELAGGPAEKLIFANCAHVPHREAAAPAMQAMKWFIEGLASRPTSFHGK